MHPRPSPLSVLLPAFAITLAACGSGGGSQSSSLVDTIPPAAGTVNDGIGGDVDSQTSTTTIRANWNGFADDTGVTQYRWAIGTSPGGSQLQSWTSVGLSTQATNSSLSLSVGATVYCSVRAYDAAGNEGAVASSDGVSIAAGGGGGGGGQTGTASSVTQWGITWTFAQPRTVGQFCNGDWWVLGPVSITQITPQTAVVGGRSVHGSMLNPSQPQMTGDHGYDSTLFGPFAGTKYHPELNVAIGISASTPLVLTGGQSLISTISWTSASPPANGSVSQIQTAAVLTVLTTQPAADAFRPPYSGSDKTVRHRESQLDYTALGNLQPVAGMANATDLAPQFQRVWLDHMSSWASRYMHPIENMPDYGRDFTALYGSGCLVLMTNLSNAQKRDLLVRMVQIGIDHYGNVLNGASWESVGGQCSGRKFPILLAGAVLNYAPMLNIGNDYPSGYFGPGNPNNRAQFGEDASTFFVQQTSPGVYNWGYGGYDATWQDIAEWGNGHSHAPQNDNSGWDADPYRRCCTANCWIGQTLAARIMGLRTLWNHPAYFDYMDRYMQTEPAGWTRAWEAWHGTMWDTYRNQF